MVCGKFPFKGISSQEILFRIRSRGINFPPFVSEKVKTLIKDILTYQYDARPDIKKVNLIHKTYLKLTRFYYLINE